jgi:CubicO group peptidase (beta-lactamase class C family)
MLKLHRLPLIACALFLGLLNSVRADVPTPIVGALGPYVDRHELAGAMALVADRDSVLTVETVGFSDIEAKKPMPPDALFWIASQSKPITATALMMLVDEGKVNIDDAVEKYLPEFRGQWLEAERDNRHLLLKHPRHPITVKNILSHTSGLPFKCDLEQPTLDLLPLRVGAMGYAMTPLVFEPDTKYQYSNAGINTAGRIIEVVSGMPYEKFLDKRLFSPLGMRDTTFWPKASQLKRLAKAYRPNAAKDGLEETTILQLKYPLDDRSRQPMPAGGLFSTAQDLVRFCQMVLNGGTFEGKQLLSEASVRKMTSRQTPEDLKQAYGLGWKLDKGSFGHGGAFATNMDIDPNRGLITIFLVQHQGFPGKGKESLGAFREAAVKQFAKE